MWIKFLQNTVVRNIPGPRKNWHIGDIDNLPDDWAADLIKACRAEETGKPSVFKKTDKA